MVVGYLKNREAEFNGQKKKFKAGALSIPFLSKISITLNQNTKENISSNDPVFYINLTKAKGEGGPKSRIGALWLKKIEKETSAKYGQEYLSGSIETPVVPDGKLYISIFKTEVKEGEKEKDWDYEIVWNPPVKKQDDVNYVYSDTYIPDDYEIIDDEQIPF